MTGGCVVFFSPSINYLQQSRRGRQDADEDAGVCMAACVYDGCIA